MSIEWGPWRYKGSPDLGDYIQVEGHLQTTREPFRAEGLVCSVVRDPVYGKVLIHLLGHVYDSRQIAERWRLGREPEGPSTISYVRKQEIEYT